MTTFKILHISDLHISLKDNFDRSVVLDPLIERVKKDRDNGLKPEIVIVSGDIAFQGLKEDRSYIVVGGTKGLGLSTVEWMASRGKIA